jgi:hypothetical protein
MRKTDVRTGIRDSIVEGIALLGSRHPLSGKDAGAGGARLVTTDVGWTARMRHDTTAAPHLDHCDAVRPHKPGMSASRGVPIPGTGPHTPIGAIRRSLLMV